MTDPRIAALAEAMIESDMIRRYREYANLLPTMDRHEADAEIARDWAAAILAALPPDWCGHIGVEEAIAQGQRMLVASEQAADREIARLRAEHEDDAERIGLYLQTLDNMNAELARLRKIEEAARALLPIAEDMDASLGDEFGTDSAAVTEALAALRAALEDKP